MGWTMVSNWWRTESGVRARSAHIAPQPTLEPRALAGVHIDREIEDALDRAAGQQVQPLDQDHRGRPPDHGLGASAVGGEVVERRLHCPSRLQPFQVIGQQGVLLGRRFVEIEAAGIEAGHGRRVDIVIVLGDHIGPLWCEVPGQRRSEARLAGGRASDNAQEKDPVRHADRLLPPSSDASSSATPGSSGMRGG